MIIKKYIVSDMKEALVRAKYELGSEAIIVSQRQVRTGKWYNFLRKKELEVTVAIEHKSSATEEVNEEIPLRKKDVALNTSNKDLDMVEEIDVEPFFSGSSMRIKEQLINYCKLHEKDNYHLSLKEKKDFLNIVLKDSLFQKDVELSRINVLVGPTGVGKTTTIAKLASHEYLLKKKKVGLIPRVSIKITSQSFKSFNLLIISPGSFATSRVIPKIPA